MNSFKRRAREFALMCALPVFAEGAPLSGELLFDVACRACHSLGADHRVGPPLGGLARREVGSVEGYPYSEALMAAGGNWTVASLAAWLTDPDRFAPNTTMKYNNELTATEIQELSEWLMAQP